MAQWLEAFGLGSAAILTNACLLPLYPGLIAFMAGTADAGRPRRVTGLLGVFVLLGVLVMMVLIGLVVLALRQTMGSLLQYLLPLIYGVVIVFGVLLLLDRSPFARFATLQTPLLRNPYAAAFVYGLLLGPMTLPCTGPIITSAFVLGAGDAGMLADGLLYFLFFGLGFGWPLVLLPLLALPLQKRLVGWLARNHTMLNRASGVLLVAVGVFGIVTELLPQVVPQLIVTPTFWAVYWLLVAAAVALVATVSRAPKTR
jgi:cytochrome c-type biogenesis protein